MFLNENHYQNRMAMILFKKTKYKFIFSELKPVSSVFIKLQLKFTQNLGLLKQSSLALRLSSDVAGLIFSSDKPSTP